MEYPYLALLWSPHHEKQIIEASRLLLTIRRHCPGLHPLIIRQGFAVFTRLPPEETEIPPFLGTYVLSRQRGVILGNLFRRGGGSRFSTREMAADSDFADASVAACRRRLTEDCWGTYVALLSDPESGDWSILRDCSGMIPCYYTTIQEVTIVFSDVRDLRMHSRSDAWLVPLAVNWRYIAGFLAASQMQIRESGFEDVYELLAGESLQSTAGRRSVDIFWNPVSIAETDPLCNVEDACRQLRETTCGCIEAWAGVHHHIAHSLSGGFDSSLVLSLLMCVAKRPEVISVNRFGCAPSEDERQYARVAARVAGVELIELPYEERPLESVCAEIPSTVKPNISQVFAGMDSEIQNALATFEGIEDIWTGQGGDHLFMAIKTGMAVADCFRDNGFGILLKTVFKDAATLTGKSYFRLARDAQSLRRADKSSSAAKATAGAGFLATAGSWEEVDTYVRHPWTPSSASLPPAKRLQVLYLAEVLNRHRPNYGIQKLQEFHPLLSQPLIEVCLRVPVYHLLMTGKTRGLARKAFQADLPPAIRDRQQKGQTTHHALGLVRGSQPYITARLLDGRLADQQLVNRDALRAALQPHAPISGPTLFSLFACLAAEVWLEDWIGSKFARYRSTPL
ncbi:MAG: hypothetical protein HIU85_02415 [Proteobacteria bacterium]|nr:hypothetical protein [Pseudomonadota bacterium]